MTLFSVKNNVNATSYPGYEVDVNDVSAHSVKYTQIVWSLKLAKKLDVNNQPF